MVLITAIFQRSVLGKVKHLDSGSSSSYTRCPYFPCRHWWSDLDHLLGFQVFWMPCVVTGSRNQHHFQPLQGRVAFYSYPFVCVGWTLSCAKQKFLNDSWANLWENSHNQKRYFQKSTLNNHSSSQRREGTRNSFSDSFKHNNIPRMHTRLLSLLTGSALETSTWGSILRK